MRKILLNKAIWVFQLENSPFMSRLDYCLHKGDEIVIGEAERYTYDHRDMNFYPFEYLGDTYYAREDEIKDLLSRAATFKTYVN